MAGSASLPRPCASLRPSICRGEAMDLIGAARHLRRMPSPAIAIGVAIAGCLALPVLAQIAVRNQGYIPYSDAPINYRSQDLSDPVALLEKQIEAGKAGLSYDADQGYLRSVLNLLKVPVDSQTLVFSK